MLKFADGTKLGNILVTLEDCENLQKCLDDLVAWEDIWTCPLMLVNTKSCMPAGELRTMVIP